MWRAVPLWLVACSFEHGQAPPDGQAAADATPANFHLHVEAWMDGRSNLIITGNQLRWHHFQYAAPGREQFVNLPTKLDAAEWYPTWPDVPNAENRDCNCDSSTTALAAAVPRAASTTRLTVVQARRMPSVLQMPSAANDYTLVVELTDVGSSGSAWHFIDIDVVVN
jgi:hypothetical protein